MAPHRVWPQTMTSRIFERLDCVLDRGRLPAVRGGPVRRDQVAGVAQDEQVARARPG